MNANLGCSPYMIAASCLSLLGSGSMIIDFLLHHREKLLYHRTVFYIALSCFINGFGTMMGEPRDGSPECWFMAIITGIFSLSSIFWTVYLTYRLHGVTRVSDSAHRPSKSRWKSLALHAACWGVPVLLTFLPLVQFSFGVPDGDYGWCFLVDHGKQSPYWLLFWWWMAFYLWVWLSIFCAAVLLIMTKATLNTASVEHQSFAIVLQALMRLRLYCAVIIISWLPYTILDLLYFFIYVPTSAENKSVCIAPVIACLQGVFTAIVYWSTEHARTNVRHKVMHIAPRKEVPTLPA